MSRGVLEILTIAKIHKTLTALRKKIPAVRAVREITEKPAAQMILEISRNLGIRKDQGQKAAMDPEKRKDLEKQKNRRLQRLRQTREIPAGICRGKIGTIMTPTVLRHMAGG